MLSFSAWMIEQEIKYKTGVQPKKNSSGRRKVFLKNPRKIF
jgi:hypothetical protein